MLPIAYPFYMSTTGYISYMSLINSTECCNYRQIVIWDKIKKYECFSSII